MGTVSTLPRKKSWQTKRELRSFEAQMAVTRERVMERLRELRVQKGTPERPLSQEDAAHLADITTRQWQRWESGESMPYTKNLAKVADAFGVGVDFFETERADKSAGTPDLMDQMSGVPPWAKVILARLEEIEHKIDGLALEVDYLKLGDAIRDALAASEPAPQTGEPKRSRSSRRAA